MVPGPRGSLVQIGRPAKQLADAGQALVPSILQRFACNSVSAFASRDLLVESLLDLDKTLLELSLEFRLFPLVEFLGLPDRLVSALLQVVQKFLSLVFDLSQ